MFNKAALVKVLKPSWSKLTVRVEDLSDEILERMLATLKAREWFTIMHRFGEPRKTLQEIGRMLPREEGGTGVGRKRVHQIEKKALLNLWYAYRRLTKGSRWKVR